MFSHSLADILLLKVPGTLSLLSSSLLMLLTALSIWAADGSRPFWRKILIVLFCWSASTFIAPLTVGFGILEFSAQLFGAIGAGIAYGELMRLRPRAKSLQKWGKTQFLVALTIVFTIGVLCLVNYKHSAALLMLIIGIYPAALAFTVTQSDSLLSSRERALIQAPFLLGSVTQIGGLWFWIYPNFAQSWRLPIPPDMMLPISTTFTTSGFLTLLAIFLSSDVKQFKSRSDAISQRRERVVESLWGSDSRSRTAMLTATLIHELKQPLTTIITAIHLSKKLHATKTETHSVHPDLIELIKTATEQANGILKKAHQPDLRSKEPINWASISETIKAQFMLLYGQSIELDFVLQDINPLFQSDPVRIYQILTNLIRNSANALDQDAGTIRVTVSQNGDAVTIDIEDTGPGFPSELLQNKTKSHQMIIHSSDGLGLGLIISRRLVQGLGGDLSLSNPESGGALVRLSIPLHFIATEDYVA